MREREREREREVAFKKDSPQKEIATHEYEKKEIVTSGEQYSDIDKDIRYNMIDSRRER